MDTKQKTFIENYFQELKHCIDHLDRRALGKTIALLIRTYKKQKTVFIIGNGGSASTASHMACDLGKGAGLRVLSLTDNMPIITAYANDVSYEGIFVQQLRNLIQKGDILIALSGSGNSKNIIKAVSFAHRIGIKTIGILGFKTGGKVASIVDIALIADSKYYGPCEDIQLILDHVITSWITNIYAIH